MTILLGVLYYDHKQSGTRKEKKNTKYFLNLENNKNKKSHIRKILNKDENLTSNPKEIMKELLSFYSYLYCEKVSAPPVDTQNEFLIMKTSLKFIRMKENHVKANIQSTSAYKP